MRFVWLQMFKLEHCPAVPDRSSQRGETTACPNGTGVRRHGLPVSQVARQVCWAVSDLPLLRS